MTVFKLARTDSEIKYEDSRVPDHKEKAILLSNDESEKVGNIGALDTAILTLENVFDPKGEIGGRASRGIGRYGEPVLEIGDK